MSLKAIFFLAFFLATYLHFPSQVAAARELAETSNTLDKSNNKDELTNGVGEAKYPGGDQYGGYPGGGYSPVAPDPPYPGGPGYGGYEGYPRGYGGYPPGGGYGGYPGGGYGGRPPPPLVDLMAVEVVGATMGVAGVVAMPIKLQMLIGTLLEY